MQCSESGWVHNGQNSRIAVKPAVVGIRSGRGGILEVVGTQMEAHSIKRQFAMP